MQLSDYIFGTPKIAEFLGTYQVAALRLVRSGAIPDASIETGRWCVPRASLEAYRDTELRRQRRTAA